MRRAIAAGRTRGLAAGLVAAGLLLVGCANLPSSGSLSQNSLPRSDISQESQIVITPRGPSPQWQPEDIVRGFLVASGANLSDESIAREYLTGYYRRHWKPSVAPSIIDSDSNVALTKVPFHVTGNQSSAQVTVTSQHLETLVAAGPNEAGRLQVSQATGPYKYTFDLVQGSNGGWRIDSITGLDGKTDLSLLLITDSDFERDYLPRNLYYLASGSSETLVPYPVYIPGQELQQTGVQQLVDAVRRLPPSNSNWLYHAIGTAFPPGTKISVQMRSNQAVVTLGGKAARTDTVTLGQMEAQLVWTLTDAPDAEGTGVGSVELHVGHSSAFLLKRKFTSWVQQGPAGPLYYQKLDRSGRPLLEQFRPNSDFGAQEVGRTGGAAKKDNPGGVGTPLVLPAPLGRGAFTSIAISPAPFGGANTFAGCRGRKVYVAPLLVNSDLQQGTLPADCTSMTWDDQGDLWVAAGTDVYVVNETVTGLLTGLQVTLVTIPAPQVPASDTIVSLKVAPDGVRVAMIVRGARSKSSKGSASVIVTSITKKPNSALIYLAQGVQVLTVGPDLVDPTALCWWDSDHLLVLDHRHGVAQLYEVPLDGGASAKVPTPSGVTSVTANGSFMAVGTSGLGGRGQSSVLAASGLEGTWVQVDSGGTPAYVGLAVGVRLTPSRLGVNPLSPPVTPRRSFRRFVL